MKKLLALSLVVAAVLTIGAFAACGEPEHTHTFGEWEVVRAATCTDGGEEARVCDCGERETRVVAALGHAFGEDAEYKTQDGALMSFHRCERCGIEGTATEVEGATVATVETLADVLAAADENATVYVAEGTYSADVTVATDGIRLIGMGAENTVFTGAVSVTADDATVEGIGFRHAYAQEEVGTLVFKFAVSGENFTMNRCEVRRMTGVAQPYGFVLSVTAASGTVTLKNSTLIGPVAGDTSAIHQASPSVIGIDSANVRLTMDGCTVKTNGYGIFSRIPNAVYRNVTFDGIQDVEDLPADVTVKSLYMAMNYTGVEDVTFDGCTVKNSRSWGMLVGGRKLTVKDSSFSSISGTAIGFSWGTIADCTISGNSFDMSTIGYGISFAADSLAENAVVTVENNTFRDIDGNPAETKCCIRNMNDVAVTATGSVFVNCAEEFRTVGAVTLA